jgi:hypothetical protein
VVPLRTWSCVIRASAERLALVEIEAALARLGAGRFGWCQQCGTAITAARLAELPQATGLPGLPSLTSRPAATYARRATGPHQSAACTPPRATPGSHYCRPGRGFAQ